MNWPTEHTEPCIFADTGETATCAGQEDIHSDERCNDPAWAAAHPEVCANVPSRWLEVRPATSSIPILGSVQLSSVLHVGDQEIVLDETYGVVWTSTSQAIAVVSGSTGNVTGVAEGIASVQAEYQTLTGYAQIQVMAEDVDCASKHVGIMVCLDASQSMTQVMGGGFATKWSYAQKMARDFIGEINTVKDTVGLVTFDHEATVVSAPTTDTAALIADLNGISPASATGSNIVAGLKQSALALGDYDINAILLITDGWEDELSAATLATWRGALAGKDIVVMVAAVRSYGLAYTSLQQLATGGFFLSAHAATAPDTLDYVSGLKGYICAGDCNPVSDVTVTRPAQDYNAFTNWDVTAGHVDLIGAGSDGEAQYDFLPGNGLYLDLSGSTTPFKGELTSKVSYLFEEGVAYKIRVTLAGNQREDTNLDSVLVSVGTLYSVSINIGGWLTGFTEFEYDFTGDGLSYPITIEQVATGDTQFYGNLLAVVELVSVDGETETQLLYDDFDAENTTYIPPANYGGYGCLDTPPPQQVPDPAPQPLLE